MHVNMSRQMLLPWPVGLNLGSAGCCRLLRAACFGARAAPRHTPQPGAPDARQPRLIGVNYCSHHPITGYGLQCASHNASHGTRSETSGPGIFASAHRPNANCDSHLGLRHHRVAAGRGTHATSRLRGDGLHPGERAGAHGRRHHLDAPGGRGPHHALQDGNGGAGRGRQAAAGGGRDRIAAPSPWAGRTSRFLTLGWAAPAREA
jgi:hypothetical protein